MMKQYLDIRLSLLNKNIEKIKAKFGDLNLPDAINDLNELCAKDNVPIEIIRNSDSLQLYTYKHIRTVCSSYGMPLSVVKLFSKIFNFFSVAPASTKFHGDYFGGLLDHTMLVCNKAVELAKVFCFDSYDNLSSLIKCALVHDLGKLGVLNIYSMVQTPMYIVNPDFSKHKSEPFIYNKDLLSMPHELRTLKILHDFNINLTDEEYQAIYYHAGAYKPNYLNEVKKESKLAVILHSADNLVAKILNH